MEKKGCEPYRNLAFVLLRLGLGVTFLFHGSQLVFGAFGGPGLAGFAGFVSQKLGLPPFLGKLAALFQLGGGLLVLLGVATELGALAILVVMLVAIFKVHLVHGFSIQSQGFEYNFNLIVMSLALIVGGPGKFFLYDPFRKWREKCGD